VAILLGLWLTHLWSAEKQVQLHSEHFLRQIENRNTDGAGSFVAANYHDDWGNDRALFLTRLRFVLNSVSRLTTQTDEPEITTASDATWKARIRINAAGTELAFEINRRINGLTTPFEFQWRRESWKPWDWKLVGIRNPSLQIPTSNS
jgi:hypothetical protein